MRPSVIATSHVSAPAVFHHFHYSGVGITDRLVLRGGFFLRRELRLAFGDFDLLLELDDLLAGDLAVIDRLLDRIRRNDVPHQRLLDLNPLLGACLAQFPVKFLLEFQFRIAADEITRIILTARKPAETPGIRKDYPLFQKRNQIPAIGIFHIYQRQFVWLNAPLDEPFELNIKAISRWEMNRVVAAHLKALRGRAHRRHTLLIMD